MLSLLLSLGAGMSRAVMFEVVNCIGMRYSLQVIVGFRHKGLEALYERNSTKGVQAEHAPKLRRILSALDVAVAPGDLDIPGFRLHPLKGRLRGHWSIWVSSNWRVTFRFIDSDIELVDYLDYH
jgi:proteic killer suppression protein